MNFATAPFLLFPGALRQLPLLLLQFLLQGAVDLPGLLPDGGQVFFDDRVLFQFLPDEHQRKADQQKATGEPDQYIPCDILVVAIGQNIETDHFAEAGIPVERGKIVTTAGGDFLDMPGVFAGGDCASGPATVIKAIAAAKVVAANIDEYLGYHHEISCDVEIPKASLHDRVPCGRAELTEREACERVCDFEGVENCMTEKEAKQEACRCLRCDHFGYGIFKGGREKLW